MPLIHYHAKRARRHYPLLEYQDLVAVGMEAAWFAWKNYEAEKGWAFSTYAYTKIGAAMVDFRRTTDWGRRRRSKGSRPFKKAPIFVELKDLGAARSPDHAPGVLRAHDVRTALLRLPERLRKPLWLRYWEDRELKDIGKILGYTESNAHLTIKKALQRLKEWL